MNKRLLYIDSLRGLAILMVVYSHILSFSMGGIDPSPFGGWMREVMLPLFFFISGFCSFKIINLNSSIKFFEELKSKIIKILIPTIVMFYAFCFITGNDAVFYALSYDKCGYWFTWILFQILLIYIISSYIASFFSKSIYKIIIILAPIVLMAIIFNFIGFESKYAVFFEWVKLKLYYFYFLLGVFTNWFDNCILKILQNKYINLILFAVIILPFCKSVHVLPPPIIYLSISVLILYYIFFRFENLISYKNKIASQLILFGRNTMAIYFIHFYFLFRIPLLPEWLESLKNDICFGSNSSSSFVEFIIVMAIAVLISYVCIGVKKILQLFPIVKTLSLG